MKKIIDNIPFHSLLIAFLAVLGLWLVNIDQVKFHTVWSSLVYALIVFAITFSTSFAITRHLLKAGFLCSLVLLLFFTYGHVEQLLKGFSISGFLIGRQRYILVFWGLIFLLGIYFIFRRKKVPVTLNRYLNLWMGIILLLILVQVGVYEIKVKKAELVLQEQMANMLIQQNSTALTDEQPDIYYILIDGYSRTDVLRGTYDVDNSDFLDQLRELGFVIPNCTQSNYTNTLYSMTATLNMNYLDSMGIPLDENADEAYTYKFGDLVKHSLVRKELQSMGYKIVTFNNIFSPIDVKDSDYYFDVRQHLSSYNALDSVNFKKLFLSTTLVRIALSAESVNPQIFTKLPDWLRAVIEPGAGVSNSDTYLQYQQNLYSLNMLEEIATTIPEKHFVYAHLFITHPPFVFTTNGDMRTDSSETPDAFRDQVIFADKKLLEVVQSILQNSDTPPIIIIQGDHSYGWNEDRNKILNAYYLPGGGSSMIYDTITPVNSFRVIFEYYFEKDYPMLSDISYYSSQNQPNKFQEITVTCSD